jgi:hypothetical protein
MEVIKEIGAYLGLAAFLALAVLVMLYFQQARDVRRLREWAGRAPERAAAAVEDATAAAAEEAGVSTEDVAPEGGVSDTGSRFSRVMPGGLRERLPEPRYLIAILAAVVGVAAGVVLTGGFGLLGDDKSSKAEKQADAIKPSSITVSVLNATGVAGAPGVPGLAEDVAEQVKKLGYEVGAVTDAGTTNALTDTLIEYKGPNDRDAAKQVSADLKKTLGGTKLLEMTPEVEPLTEGAPVAVVIGTNNSQL